MKTVAQFTHEYEAEIAKGFLESEGIESAILNVASSYPCINEVSGIKLVVNDEDYEAASKLLATSQSVE